jgi:hypothetical protein
VSRERLFVTHIPTDAGAPEIRSYDITSISHLCADAPANGFSLIIIPAFSATHSLYARKAPEFEDMFMKPVVGWIAGCHLDDLGRVAPAVVSGPELAFDTERAVVMHVPLPPQRYAHVHIANRMRQGEGGLLRFPETGFSAGRCSVDGVETTLAAYLDANRADLRLPSSQIMAARRSTYRSKASTGMPDGWISTRQCLVTWRTALLNRWILPRTMNQELMQ